MHLKILHITNHPGTILNANQVVSYINQSSTSKLQLDMKSADKTVRYNRLDETFEIIKYLKPYSGMNTR
jgi:hypothetical protein